MIKNIVSSTAARLAAAALCVAAAGSLSAEEINLSGDAFSRNLYTIGYRSQLTANESATNLFDVTKANARYITAANKHVPSYVAFGFNNDYEPGKLIVCNRIVLATVVNSSWYTSHRLPTDATLQGSNDPDDMAAVEGMRDNGADYVGNWKDIKSWPSLEWHEVNNYHRCDLRFGSQKGYRYYRLKFSKISGNQSYLLLSQMQLWGTAVSPMLCAPGYDSVKLTLSVHDFDFDNQHATSTIYLDYSTDPGFGEEVTTHLLVDEDVTSLDGWSKSIDLSGLSEGTVYYCRCTIVNSERNEFVVDGNFETQKRFFVAESGDDENGDGTEVRPYRSISKALVNTSARPLVIIGAGTYSQSSGESFPIVLTSGAELKGAGADVVTVDGGNVNASLVRSTNNGDGCHISGIHFANSNIQPAISSEASDIVISNCSFSQTQAQSGGNETTGALLVTGKCRAFVKDCEFELGTQTRHWIIRTTGTGGEYDTCYLTVSNCTFTGNTVIYGLIGCAQETMRNNYTITDCLFSSNKVTSVTGVGSRSNTPAGCITMMSFLHRFKQGNTNYVIPYGELFVDRCRFISNRTNAAVAALFSTDYQNCVIQNSLFSKNSLYSTAGNYLFGVIRTYYSIPCVSNCTFIRNYGHFCESYSAEFYNCIFSNEGELLPLNKTFVMRLYNAIVNETEFGNAAKISAVDVIYDDPCFVDEESGRIHTSSPAFDAGNDSYAAGDFDLRGNPRVAGKHVDLGAIECQGRPALILIVR